MMNRIRIAFSCFALLTGLSWQGCDTSGDFDEPDVDYFVKYYGTSLGNQAGVDMVVNQDGAIIIVGTSEVGLTSRTYFLKVDALGNVLVEKYLSGPSDHVKDIEPFGNDYLILSEFTVEGTENVDVKLIRVTADGIRIDSVSAGTFAGDGSPLNDYPKDIKVVTNTNRIIVSGSSDNVADNSSPNPDYGDFLVLAFDANPNLAKIDWNTRPTDFPGFDDLDVLAGTVEAKFDEDGSDIFCAIGFSSGGLASTGDQQLFYFGMAKADGQYLKAGTVANVPAGSDCEILEAFSVESINAGYFFVGNIRSSVGRTELFFGKLRSSLSFGSNDVQFLDKLLPAGATNFSGVSACQSNMAPEGYLIAGVDTKATGSTDIWVVKIDLSGQVVWASNFGSDQGDDAAAKIIELVDGRVLVLGTTELGDNQRKLSLIKMNSSGQLQK